MNRLALFSILTLILSINLSLNAATLNVPGDHATISAAIAAASPGDTIVIATGYYSQPTLVISKNLTIQGAGPDATTIQSVISTQDISRRTFAVSSGATATIDGVTIRGTGPSFSYYGGIDNSGTLTVMNSTIYGNSAASGGGIYNNGTLTVTNSKISGNSAAYFGGGIYNNGTVTVTNSTISGNSTGSGGGIHNYGTVTVTNSTISGNSASVSGGGIWNGSTVTVTNSTISRNSGSVVGGGIVSQNNQIFTLNTTIGNTIVAQNNYDFNASKYLDSDPDVDGTFTSLGNNLIGRNDGATGFTHGVNGDQVGTATAPKDARLGALADNGGPTQTHALLTSGPASPAIDAGSDTLPANLITDQRGAGFYRVSGTKVDIGAYESSSLPAGLFVDKNYAVLLDGTTVTFPYNNGRGNLIFGTGPNTSGKNAFATINLAVAAATDGQTIYIAPGTYAESVIVNKQVIIQGAGTATIVQPGIVPGPTFTPTGNVGFFVTSAGSGATIRDLKIDRAFQGVRFEHAGQTISGVTLKNLSIVDSGTMNTGTTSFAGVDTSAAGINKSVTAYIAANFAVAANGDFVVPGGNAVEIHNQTTVTNLNVTGCTFSGNQYGIHFATTSAVASNPGMTVSDSTFTNNKTAGIGSYALAQNFANVTIKRCTFSNSNTLTTDDDTLAELLAKKGWGIYVEGFSTLTVGSSSSSADGNTFSDNLVGIEIFVNSSVATPSGLTIGYNTFKNHFVESIIGGIFQTTLTGDSRIRGNIIEQNVGLLKDVVAAIDFNFDDKGNTVGSGIVIELNTITLSGTLSGQPSLYDSATNVTAVDGIALAGGLGYNDGIGSSVNVTSNTLSASGVTFAPIHESAAFFFATKSSAFDTGVDPTEIGSKAHVYVKGNVVTGFKTAVEIKNVDSGALGGLMDGAIIDLTSNSFFGRAGVDTQIIGIKTDGGAATHDQIVNASGNWWSTTDPTKIRDAMKGPGTSISAAYVDFTPFLNSGADTNKDTVTAVFQAGMVGFQGDFSFLNVTNEGGQTGTASRIQEGVITVWQNGTVNLLDRVKSVNGVSSVLPATIETRGDAGNPGDFYTMVNTTLLTGLTAPANQPINVQISFVQYDFTETFTFPAKPAWLDALIVEGNKNVSGGYAGTKINSSSSAVIINAGAKVKLIGFEQIGTSSATDPAIMVNGNGTLIVRKSTILESSGGNGTAIKVAQGGTIDLGTAETGDNKGENTLQTQGDSAVTSSGSVPSTHANAQFITMAALESATPIMYALGNIWKVNGADLATASRPNFEIESRVLHLVDETSAAVFDVTDAQVTSTMTFSVSTDGASTGPIVVSPVTNTGTSLVTALNADAAFATYGLSAAWAADKLTVTYSIHGTLTLPSLKNSSSAEVDPTITLSGPARSLVVWKQDDQGNNQGYLQNSTNFSTVAASLPSGVILNFQAVEDVTTAQNIITQYNSTPGSNIQLEASPSLPNIFAVTITNSNGNLRLNGFKYGSGSPAVTVSGGTVTFANSTFSSTAADPTVLVVSGGTAIIRNSTISESSNAAAQAAIVVNAGGALDLGVAGPGAAGETNGPGNNAINIVGSGTFLDNQDDGDIWALGNSWQVNGTATSDNFFIEDKISHEMDVVSNGLIGRVIWVQGNLYVTTSTYSTAGLSGIQHAISMATANDIIHVNSGTYTGDLDLNMALELRGVGAATTTIKGVSVTATPNIDIDASSVKISGFTIESPDAVAANKSQGIVLLGTNIEIANNIFKTIQSSTSTVGTDSSFAIQTDSAGGDISGLYIHDNTFQGTPNNGYKGIYIRTPGAGTPVSSSNPVRVATNTFTGTIYNAITAQSDYTQITGNTITTGIANTETGSGIRVFADADESVLIDIVVSSNRVETTAAGKGFAAALSFGDATVDEVFSNMTLSSNTLSGDHILGIFVADGVAGVPLSLDAISAGNNGVADAFTVELVGTEVRVKVNGLVVFTSNTTTALTLDGSNDDDTFTINLDAVPANGITFNGGSQSTTGDSLVINAGTDTPATVTHTFASASSGSVASDTAGTISYTGLEPIADNLDPATRVFTFTGGAENIVLSDDGQAADNQSKISSTLGETVTFTHTGATSLTINAGTGADIVRIEGQDSGFTANITVNGDAGNDNVYMTSFCTNYAGTVVVSGGADDDTFFLSKAGAPTTLTDFDVDGVTGTDVIRFDRANVAAFATGTSISDDNDDDNTDDANFQTIGYTNIDTIAAANGPNINDISDITIDEDDGVPAVVQLSGINNGDGLVTSLIFSSATSNADLVPAPAVVIDDSNVTSATGSLSLFPVPNATGTATISVTVTDTADSISKTVFFDVTVTVVNDAPSIASPGSAGVSEETNLTFTTTISVDDDGTGTLELSLQVASGTLTLASTTDLTITRGANAGAAVTFTGSEANVNAALDGLIYRGNTNFVGTDLLHVAVNDGSLTDTSAVTIHVANVNDAPVGVDDTGATTEESMLSVSASGVLANDTDVDSGDTKTVSTADIQSDLGAIVAVNANGSYTYDPRTASDLQGLVVGETITDTFSYTVRDAAGATDTATVTITVTGVNDVPTANDDTGATTEDATLTQTTSVVGNDVEIDLGDTKGVSAYQNPSAKGAAVNVSGDGTYTYNPTGSTTIQALDGGDNDTDTFTYTLNDGKGGTDTATVTITLTGLNDAPSAVNDSSSTDKGTAKDIFVLTNDDDVDADHTVGTNVLIDDTATPDTSVQGATITVVGNKIVYNPVPSATLQAIAANGSMQDTFTYTIKDPANATSTAATVTVTVTGEPNFAPVAGNDPVDSEDPDFATRKDTVLLIAKSDLLANDTDTDAPGQINKPDTVSFSAFVDNTTIPGLLTDVGANLRFDPTNGGANNITQFTSLGFRDTYTYTFTYKATDGKELSNSATVTIIVYGLGNVPTIGDIANVSFAEDPQAPYVVSFSGVTNGEVAPDNISRLRISASSGNTAIIPDPLVEYGSPNGSGKLNLFPVANATGTVTITVTVVDVEDALQEAFDVFDVTVTAVNDAPVGVKDTGATTEDAMLSVAAVSGVLANDTDIDAGASLTAVAVTNGRSTEGATVAINADGSYTYDPRGVASIQGLDDTESLVDTFFYAVMDGTATVTNIPVEITVTGVNDAPVASSQFVSTAEDMPLVITVAAGDVDGDTLTFTVPATTAPAASGTLSGSGPVVTYTPAANFNGIATFAFTVNDGTATSAAGVVTITVNSVNDLPVATAQSVTTDEGTAKPITLAGTDTETATGSLTYAVASTPTHGTLSGTTPDLTYTPIADFNGPDSFTFTVNDGSANSAVAAVNITVTSVPDAPVAVDDGFTVREGSTNILDVRANDTDADGDTLTVTAVGAGSQGGTIAIANSGTAITYAPVVTIGATETFTYTISDGATTDTATVTITVSNVNNLPTAVNDVGIIIAEDSGANTINVLANDGFSPDVGETLTITAISHGTSGTVAITNAGANLTYTPDGNYFGDDLFTYTISDGNGGNATATVNLTVTNVNDAPTVASDVFVVNKNSTNILDVMANDWDVDGDWISITAVTQGTLGTVAIVNDPAGAVGGTEIYYVADPNETGVDTFTYTVFDGTTTVIGTVTSLTVIDPNDDNTNPSLIGIGGTTVTYTEGGAAVAIAPAGAVTDSDLPSFLGGLLRVSITAGAGQGDVLAVVAGGAISTAQNLVLFNSATNVWDPIGEFSGGVGAPLTIHFTTTVATPAAVTALIQRIMFSNTSDDPKLGNRTLTTELTDGNTGSASATSTVVFQIINDAPMFDILGDVDTIEDENHLAVTGGHPVLGYAFDVFAGPPSEHAVQTVAFSVTNDNNALFATQPQIAFQAPTGTYDLTFHPAANTNGQAMVTVTLIDDGGFANGGDDESDAQLFVIQVEPVNDAPSFATVADYDSAPTSQLINDVSLPGAARLIAGSGATVTANLFSSGSISKGPADEAGQTLQFVIDADDPSLFTVQPTISTSTGIITFATNAATSGNTLLKIWLKDNGGTANGGDDTSAAFDLFVVIEKRNIAPTVTAPTATLAVAVNTDRTLSGITVGDVDATGADSIQVTVNATNGTLNGGAPPLVLTNTVSALNTALNAIVFRGSLDYHGPATVTITVDDLGIRGFGVPLTAAATINLFVGQTNATPTVAGPASKTVTDAGEGDFVAMFTGTDAISVSDDANAAADLRVTITVALGSVSLDATALADLAFSTGDGTDDSSMVFDGTLTEINAALNPLNYLGIGCADTITITVNDLGNTGFGGAKSATKTIEIPKTGGAVSVAPVAGSVGHWAMDEGSGTAVADGSGNGNNGVATNGPTILTSGTTPPSKVGNARLFDGGDDFIEVTNGSTLNFTTQFTIAAWVRPTAAKLSMIVNNEGRYEVGMFPDRTLQFAVANSTPGWAWVNTGALLPLHTWTHVAITYDAGAASNQIRAYVNGAQVFTSPGSGSIGDDMPNRNQFRIGGRSFNTTDFFAGGIDEVIVYARALNSAEIGTVFNATTPAAAFLTFSSFPANIAVACSTVNPVDPAPAVTGTPTATTTDPCATGAPTITYVNASSASVCPRTVTRTWTAFDGINTITGVQTITVTDTEAPVLTDPADITVQCHQTSAGTSGSPGVPGFATATDCNTYTITYTDVNSAPSGCSNSYTITRTWKATDACGNVATANQIITVQDTTVPAIATFPSSVTLECDSAFGTGALPDIGVAAGYWPLDESSGTVVADGSGNSNNGVATNGPTILTAGTAPPSKFGNARLFDGVDDFIEVTNGSALNFTTQFTIAAWVRPTAAKMSMIVNNEGRYEIGMFPDQKLQFAVANSTPGWAWVNTGAVLPLNTWTHVALTYNSGAASNQFRVYVNGAQLFATAGTGAVGDDMTNRNQFRIGGRSYNATDFFQGGIDEVRVYARDLSASEISGLYNPVTTPSTDPQFTGRPTATDNCGGAITIDYEDEIIAGVDGECPYTINRLWTITDVCGNSIDNDQLIVIAEPTPATVSSAALNYDSGQLVVQFALTSVATPPVTRTVATVDLSKFHLSDVPGTPVVNLSSPTNSATISGTTVTITLTSAQLDLLVSESGSGDSIALDGDGAAIFLDVDAGAIVDTGGTGSAADSDQVVESFNAPALTGTATMNYTDGASGTSALFVFKVTKEIVAEGIVLSGLHLNETTGNDATGVTLTGATIVSVVSTNNSGVAPRGTVETTVSIRLTATQRRDLIQKSGVAGGNGSAVRFDLDANALTGLLGQKNVQADNNAVTETADTKKPVLVSATLDFDSGSTADPWSVLTLTFDEPIKTAAVNPALIYINDHVAYNLVNLEGATVAAGDALPTSITLSLTDMQRTGALRVANSASTGVSVIGDADSPVVAFAAGAITDYGLNTNAATDPLAPVVTAVETADDTAPQVASISINNASDTYGPGDEIEFVVWFYESVIANNTNPSLTLNSGGMAEYVEPVGVGAYSTALLFRYRVDIGDTTEDAYLRPTALTSFADIVDYAGNAAVSTLPGAPTAQLRIASTSLWIVGDEEGYREGNSVWVTVAAMTPGLQTLVFPVVFDSRDLEFVDVVRPLPNDASQVDAGQLLTPFVGNSAVPPFLLDLIEFALGIPGIEELVGEGIPMGDLGTVASLLAPPTFNSLQSVGVLTAQQASVEYLLTTEIVEEDPGSGIVGVLWITVDTGGLGESAVSGGVGSIVRLQFRIRVGAGTDFTDVLDEEFVGVPVAIPDSWGITAIDTTGGSVAAVGNDNMIVIDNAYSPADVDETGMLGYATDGVYIYRAALYGDFDGLVPVVPPIHREFNPYIISDGAIVANVLAGANTDIYGLDVWLPAVDGDAADNQPNFDADGNPIPDGTNDFDANGDGAFEAGTDAVYIFRRLKALEIARSSGVAVVGGDTVPAGHAGVSPTVSGGINDRIDLLAIEAPDNLPPRIDWVGINSGEDVNDLSSLLAGGPATVIRFNEPVRDANGDLLESGGQVVIQDEGRVYMMIWPAAPGEMVLNLGAFFDVEGNPGAMPDVDGDDDGLIRVTAGGIVQDY